MSRKDLFVGVNEAEDPKNLSDLEKKHLPAVDAPDSVAMGECFELTAEVGRLLAHPNEHSHFIEFLDVYADETYLARADFTDVTACPKVTFRLRLNHPARELRVYERCSQHGVWVTRRPIEVRQQPQESPARAATPQTLR